MKPLTIEELKKLESDDYVWVVCKNHPKDNGYVTNISFSPKLFTAKSFSKWKCLRWELYGKTWVAYKNKEQAEAKGEIVELPISIGSTVWYVNYFNEVVDGKVSMLQQKADKTWRFRFSYYSTTYKQGATHDFQLSDIGKNVFTDKSEAERRLKELKGE